jgi:indolepyruvate ferredoxin oxidoreductase
MTHAVSLDDKYDLAKHRVFLTGTQAIVRLALMQKARDKAEGLNTAGYVTGYRGSPLGGLDQQFMRAAQGAQAQQHRVPAGHQRRSGGDRAVGGAAGRDARRGRL